LLAHHEVRFDGLYFKFSFHLNTRPSSFMSDALTSAETGRSSR